MHTGRIVKAWQWILLGFIGLLLTLSVVLAQGAFRLERTILSYGFVYRESQKIFGPLDDPEIFGESLNEIYRLIIRSLPQAIPRELEPFLLKAAKDSFKPAWIRQTGAIWLASLQRVLRGESTALELQVSISPFLRRFQSLVAGSTYSSRERTYINREIDKIPGGIDAAQGMPQNLRADLIFLGRFMDLIQAMLQYIIPGILMAACFFHLRPGPGCVAVGAAFLLGSVPGILASTVFAGRIGRSLEATLSRQLPSALGWLAEGIGAMAETALRTGSTTALWTGVFGAGMICLGIFIIKGTKGRSGNAGFQWGMAKQKCIGAED
jgi:hypothetical protein